MNQEDDYSSDTSDEDFVPQGKGLEEDDSADDYKSSDDELLNEDNITAGKKSKKKVKKQQRSAKPNPLLALQKTDCETEEPIDPEPISEKENETKANDLWADFLADVDDKPAPKPKTNKKSWSVLLGNKKASISTSSGDSSKEHKETKTPLVKTDTKASPSMVKVTKIFEFAGEEVKVEEEVRSDSVEAKVQTIQENKDAKGVKRPLGLSGIVSILDNKKKKLSTLEKTKIDWNNFKSDQGIEDQLEIHKKSKHGYLDKQAFLERADLRQFEIEKNMRTNKRSNR